MTQGTPPPKPRTEKRLAAWQTFTPHLKRALLAAVPNRGHHFNRRALLQSRRTMCSPGITPSSTATTDTAAAGAATAGHGCTCCRCMANGISIHSAAGSSTGCRGCGGSAAVGQVCCCDCQGQALQVGLERGVVALHKSCREGEAALVESLALEVEGGGGMRGNWELGHSTRGSVEFREGATGGCSSQAGRGRSWCFGKARLKASWCNNYRTDAACSSRSVQP